MRSVIFAIVVIALILFLAMMAACAGKQVASNTSLRQLTQEDPYAYSYEVIFASGEKYKLGDDDIRIENDMVGIRFRGEKDFRFFPADRIREVRAKKKTHYALGAGIGAAVGFAAGLATSLAIPNNCKDDPGICRLQYMLIGIPIGTLVGTGAGMAIGSAIPKKKNMNINVSPRVYGLEGQTINGAGVGISGRF